MGQVLGLQPRCSSLRPYITDSRIRCSKMQKFQPRAAGNPSCPEKEPSTLSLTKSATASTILLQYKFTQATTTTTKLQQEVHWGKCWESQCTKQNNRRFELINCSFPRTNTNNKPNSTAKETCHFCQRSNINIHPKEINNNAQVWYNTPN